ncbi:MAG: hypothetical protein ACR2K4_05690 [Candidatus Limnocylindria bacterium]
MRRTTLPVVLAGLLTVALAIPAAGAIFERGTFTDTGTDAYTCGETEFSVSWEASGRYHLRTGKGDLDSFFFQHVNVAFHEVHTNLDTGETLTVSGRFLDKEIRATRVEGTVFEVTRIVAGQPFTVRDSDGRLLLRDRGVVVVTYLFDTLGDDVPGGDFLGEVNVELHGPHPGFDIFDPCQLWEL